MQKVPYAPPDIGNEEKRAILKVIDSNWLSQGKETDSFEKELKDHFGCKYVIVVNSGTSALITALISHGIKKGDEVLVPAFTFIASINAIIATGAKPVLVDINPKTWNTTVEYMKLKLTSKTKAIIPVDVSGMPINISKFEKFAKENNLCLIEDAAEAIGAEYRGKKIGSFNHTAIFSFHMAKLITTVEGGCITTNDEEIAKKCKMIRNHGMKGKYEYLSFGLNFRISDLHSSIGREQLKKLNLFINKRKEIIKTYKNILGKKVKYQEIPDFVNCHPFMIFGIIVKKNIRDKINKKLHSLGISTRMWPPIYQSSYHNAIFNEKFKNADDIALRLINLPIGNGLTRKQAEYVAKTLKKIINNEEI